MRVPRTGRAEHIGRRGMSGLLAAVLALGLAACGAGPVSQEASPAPTGQTPTPGLDRQLVAALEAALDESFAATQLPGVLVGLWIPGQGEWVASRGTANLETGEPMKAGNQQKIGSITKSIVTSVALQLIGEGTSGLTLEDTIDRWYPDFPEASHITVRMLMNMSSGIGPPGMEQIERICAAPYAVADPERVIAIGATTPRSGFAPGEGFTYSGFNTFLLGRILEETTGEDLAGLIQARITEPFGLSRSRFAPDGQVEAPSTHGYSLFCPELPRPTDTIDWSNAESWAAGAMVSTLDDMHAWGRALGAGAGISPELLIARYGDTAPDSGADGLAYGLGVQVHRDLATGCILDLGHSGAEPGYGTNVTYFATTDAVFVAFANGDGGTGEEVFRVVQALHPVFASAVTEMPTQPCSR
ncbi:MULTISPECIES: serine hydrolase domain-containing protein [unclassified Microbacterium]|uniref:serine hydrolase domain-containing protein n=1 Tax=unclassified Microbacterium TaxID=2609290 RepID=UPI00214ABF2C|nr:MULTISPECIES: serine hydrolase domain-containing protein [unclassified Microbacterium]MCR2809428.1 beta-lactamase family protein [Microbacterium sp. zg.B185]WIM20563.1 serine hydrolase domain-containing protein [Microbacterium sp. zg-B185]